MLYDANDVAGGAVTGSTNTGTFRGGWSCVVTARIQTAACVATWVQADDWSFTVVFVPSPTRTGPASVTCAPPAVRIAPSADALPIFVPTGWVRSAWTPGGE